MKNDLDCYSAYNYSHQTKTFKMFYSDISNKSKTHYHYHIVDNNLADCQRLIYFLLNCFEMVLVNKLLLIISIYLVIFE